MDNADKKRLLKEMIFYRRYEERTFEAYMERKIGGFLHLYSGRGLKLVSSLCTEMRILGKGNVITAHYDWGFED